jgi:hypothetical protein
MKARAIAMGAALALAGCSGSGGSGVSVPAQFLGTWGADCASPFVQFASGTAKVFPDNATYTLKSAALQGTELSVAYDDATRGGMVTDVYVAEGETLRLDRTKVGPAEATWHKAPMNRCN